MITRQKKHYLVIWPATRFDWIRMFVELKDDLEFTFIPSTFPSDPNFAKEFCCRYWSEFNSAEEVLNETQPDGLIFMSIESGLSMTLNHVAQKRGLVTYILQHGIYTNYRDYRGREKVWSKKSKNEVTRHNHSIQSFSTLKFILNTLKGWGCFWIFPISLYIMLQKRIGPYWASKHLPLKIKRATLYLCYSNFNAIIHKETDRIRDSQILYIGSPELSKYLRREKDLLKEPFYLHIDQALAENSFGEETVSPKGMIKFYLKLNDYCLSKNSKLYIKLHPESYHTKWLPDHENIHYLKHVDNFNWYIQSAIGCFGFYSTMIIPAVYWRPTILFEIDYSYLQESVNRIGVTQVLDFWNFNPTEFNFQELNKKEQIRTIFIEPYGVNRNTLRNILYCE